MIVSLLTFVVALTLHIVNSLFNLWGEEPGIRAEALPSHKGAECSPLQRPPVLSRLHCYAQEPELLGVGGCSFQSMLVVSTWNSKTPSLGFQRLSNLRDFLRAKYRTPRHPKWL